MKKALKILTGLLAVTLLVIIYNCGFQNESSSSNDGGGGGGGDSCSTGYCLNNGQCCPAASPDYTYGGQGYSAGCYPSCPYVGDCGASTQCF